MANRQKRMHPKLGKLIFFHHLNLKAQLAQRHEAVGKFCRGQVIGRLVDQITRKMHTARHSQRIGDSLLKLLRVRTEHQNTPVSLSLGGLMRRKLIETQRQPHNNLMRPRHRPKAERQRGFALAFGQRNTRFTRRIGLGRAGELNHINSVSLHPRRVAQRQNIAFLGLLKALAFHKPLQCPLGEPRNAPSGLIQRSFRAGHNSHTPLRAAQRVQIKVFEVKCHKLSHVILPYLCPSRIAARPPWPEHKPKLLSSLWPVLRQTPH